MTGIIVNKLGQRFVAEDSYHSRTSGFIMDQPDSAAYLIVDEAHLEHPKMPLVPLIDGWETVAEMEAALGIPQGNLAKTLDRYNTYAARGEDPDFHKQPEFLAAQDKGPWGAFDMSLGKAMYAGFTIGGLATSVDGQVLREDGSVVEGCTLPEPAPSTSPRTVRATPAVLSWARGRSSGAAPERTRLRGSRPDCRHGRAPRVNHDPHRNVDET